MMTLAEAIAEVRRLWAISPPSPDETNFAAIVFNAVASGELIPKADAELAIAMAYQRAGDIILNSAPRAHWLIREDILALAPAEPLAEVQALKAERDAMAKVIDDTESHYGLSSNGNMWRFWSDKAREVAARNTALTARSEAAEAEVARLTGLLGRYVEHVGDNEGTDFLARSSDYLTEDELREVRGINNAFRTSIGKAAIET